MISEHLKVGYVVKRYPRYSETFIVNEILAHEKRGVMLDIFALRASEDTHFQDILAQVKAPVTYLPDRLQRASDFWSLLAKTSALCPLLSSHLSLAFSAPVREVSHALALAAHVKRRGITHLHAHFATSATTVARLAAAFAGITYSFTAHAKDIFHDSVDPRELAQKIQDAAAVITISEFNHRHLAQQFPELIHKVTHIYNGLDLQKFAFQAPLKRPPKIVAVGRLVEKKGFKYLLDACDVLRQSGLEFTCVIIGSGEESAALHTQISALGLQDKVLMLGSRPQQEVITQIQTAAVFAAPCVLGADGNQDGLPTVLLEAMALGTPCVGTDVTGLPEVLQADMGVCLAQRDVPALADALKTLLQDPALANRLAQRARANMEQKFDIHINANTVYQTFEEGK